jgi:hypothetical protein
MRSPLFRDQPLVVQVTLLVVLPLAYGVLCGYLLGVSETWWIVANVFAVGGGMTAGYEHVGAAAGARRGLAAGLVFGLGVVLGDALLGDAREAAVPEPLLLFPLVTMAVSAVLGAFGGAMRARVEAAVAAADARKG